jgi:hypothetical protein
VEILIVDLERKKFVPVVKLGMLIKKVLRGIGYIKGVDSC